MSQENKPVAAGTPPTGGKPAGGPPMVFAMPMYHDWVPMFVRPWIYVILAFCFQFSNGMYLGALGDVVGEWSVMREDVQMCLYSTLIGMALYFPVLFRMKFRFSNKRLLMGAAIVILVCQLIATLHLPLPVLWVLCVLCGMAKIQGTFECLSCIQLWMTPKRDFGVFFPIIHIILLTSIEATGYLAAWFAFYMHWTYMHWFVMGLMLFVLLQQALMNRSVSAMPKIVPLKGVDWFGAMLWCAVYLQLAWLLNYGDWMDWWNSSQFRLVTGTTLITFAFALQRMLFHPAPYYEPAMWKYHNVVPVIVLIGVVEALFSCEHVLEGAFYGSVMHYDDLTSERLALWSIPGLWAGCLFCLGWLHLMRWNPYKLIALGLAFFSIYAGAFYFLLDSSINVELLRIPMIVRGFSYAVLSVAFIWSLNALLSFQHFFQALSVFNILHMFVGGLVGGAIHAWGMKYYVADGFARLGQYVDSVRMSTLPGQFSEVMSRLSSGLVAQSLKMLFGWTLLAGLFFCALMLLWDIRWVRTRIKRVPTWPSVGVGVLCGYKRQMRLHKLRQERRARMRNA